MTVVLCLCDQIFLLKFGNKVILSQISAANKLCTNLFQSSRFDVFLVTCDLFYDVENCSFSVLFNVCVTGWNLFLG